MHRTKLQSFVGSIVKAMDKHVAAGLMHVSRRQEICEGIFFLLAGDPVVNPALKEFCKLINKSPALLKISKAMGKEIKLPQALHGWTTKNMSLRHVLATWDVRKSDIEMVTEIAAKAGLELTDEHHLLRRRYSSMELKWMAEVESELEEVEVILGRQALQDMLLGVFETYKVPKSKSEPYSEVFGLCLGMTSRNKVNKKGIGTRTKWFVNVEKAAPQIRAKGHTDSVIPNIKSIEALIETADSLFPQLEIIGDYHSHPYLTVKKLKDNNGWEASKSDNVSIAELYRGLRSLRARQHRLRVSFIVAIAKGRNVATAPSQLKRKPSVVRMSMAGCHVYISAYRILSDGTMTTRGVNLVPAVSEYHMQAV